VNDRVEFAHNGMARCGRCGESTAPVLIGDPREVERDPNVIIRCVGCAAVEEAERITGEAAA
jgi:hypothetical protein